MMHKAYSKDSVGGDSAKAKSGAMPVLLMAIFCLVVGGIDTILSFNYTALFTFIRVGATDQIPQLLINFAITAGHDAIEQIVGIVLIVVILFMRKKHLSKISYKDFAVMAIFFVASFVFARIGASSASIAVNTKVSETSDLAAFAVMTKNGTVSMFTVPNLVNWLCLGVFVLAKTEAKKLSRIFGGAVGIVSLVLSFVCCIFARKLAVVMYLNGDGMSAAVPAVRFALLLNLFAVCVPVLFWLLYGEGKLNFVFGIIYVLLQPALVACLTVGASIVGASIIGASIADAVAAGALIIAKKLSLGLVVTTWGEPLAYIIGGAAIVGVLLLKKKREAKKAEKAAANA